MRCSYCASTILQPATIFRDTETIINEVSFQKYAFNLDDCAFYDDALFCRPLDSLTHLLKSLGKLQIRLHAPNGLHLRFLDPELLAVMKEANFVTLRFGYESGLDKFSRDTKGKVGRKLLEQKISMLFDAGFLPRQIGIYVMGGLLEQIPEDLISEIEFIHSLGVLAKPVFISPVPKTALFDYYAAQFPHIITDPLWHNDTFFITNLPRWDYAGIEEIRKITKKLNGKLS
jgi:radical SAM superfamily enzyme YgiQ (UPF0313 family)